MGIVDQERRSAIVAQGFDILIQRGHRARQREDAVGQHQRPLALAPLAELLPQVLRIAMAETGHRLAWEAARLGQTEVGRFIDQHYVRTLGHGLNKDVIARIARGKIECLRRTAEFGGQALHFQSQRAGAVAGAAGGRMDAVTVEGLAARLDHVGMARQAQVAGAAEVQVFPAVDARQCTGRAFHERGIGPAIHGGERGATPHGT